MRLRILILIALGAVGICPAQIPAVLGCTQVGVTDPNNTFLFLHASASALDQAEQALVQAKRFQADTPVTDASGAISAMTEMMTDTKLSSESYRCAMQVASAYSASKDKGTKSAAEAFVQGYSAHVQINDLFPVTLSRWRDISEHPEKWPRYSLVWRFREQTFGKYLKTAF